MFISNKYSRWYYNIVQQAQARELPKDTYVEKHHIIPKSLGGNNKKENIATLTAREHLICHLLLIRMTTSDAKSKMACAAMRMMFSSSTHSRHKISPSSRVYESVRAAVALSKKGKSNYKHSAESKKKISDSKLGKTRIFTEEWRENISKSQIGLKKTPCSEERKQKISIAQKGIPRGPQTDEHRRKVSESKKGKRIHVDPVTGRRYMA